MKYGKLEKITSGAQTGVDRGGLDAAIYLGLEHGGWCPSGRKAEDGRIPDKYKLQETWTTDYRSRTRLNVEEADATLILARRESSSGTDFTRMCCESFAKPSLDMCLDGWKMDGFVDVLRSFLLDYRVVNVAGSRESKYPGAQLLTKLLIVAALDPSKL